MNKILVATDFSAQADSLPRHVVDLARAGIDEAIILNVMEEEDRDAQESATAISNLEKVRMELASRGMRTGISLRFGHPAEEIAAAALEEKVDFIVAASHGRQYFRKAFVGSVSLELARVARVPLLVEKTADVAPSDNGSVHFHKIMVPTDFSRASLASIDFLKNMRDQVGEVLFVHIAEHSLFENEEGDEWLTRRRVALAELVEEMAGFGIPAFSYLGSGAPAREIITVAREENITMVMIPRAGSGSLVKNFFFGSVAQEVLLGVDIPVLVLPVDTGI